MITFLLLEEVSLKRNNLLHKLDTTGTGWLCSELCKIFWKALPCLPALSRCLALNIFCEISIFSCFLVLPVHKNAIYLLTYFAACLQRYNPNSGKERAKILTEAEPTERQRILLVVVERQFYLEKMQLCQRCGTAHLSKHLRSCSHSSEKDCNMPHSQQQANMSWKIVLE